MKHFGHTVRHNSLAEDIMLGPMPGKRPQGGQRKTMVRRSQRVDRSHHPRSGLPGTR